MEKPARLIGIVTLLVFLAPGVIAGQGIQVLDAWIRAAPPGAGVLAGYLTVANTTAKPVVLRSVSSPFFSRVEIHQTVIRDGMARMTRLHELVIPAHGERLFQPGGIHLMLMGSESTPRQGSEIELRLSFDQRDITVNAPVVRSEDKMNR